MRQRTVLLVATITIVASGCHAQDLTIVANGESSYEIVLGAESTKITRYAADELETWIEAATGVELPIVGAPTPDHKQIYLGASAAPAAWNLSLDGITGAGFVVKTVGEDLAMVGVDRGRHPERIGGTTAPSLCGTMNAVYDFLEEQVGVRWYWHDPLGEIVPRLDELKVPPLNYTEQPDYIYRELPYGPMAGDRQAARGQWGRRQRLGKSISTYHSHAWFRHLDIEEYAAEHPEYYALANGLRITRYYSGHHGGQVCTTNPEVVNIFAEKCRQYFRDHADRTMCSVSPNDGGGFCTCADCTTLDLAHWPEDSSRAGHPQMADRMMTFYNQIAEQVAREFPDRYLGAYVYSYYVAPPLKVKPHKNLALVLAINSAWRGGGGDFWTDDREIIDGWCAAHEYMFMYDIFYSATRGMGLPAPIVKHTIERIKHLKDVGMRGGYLYIGPTWEVLGPGAYVMARLLWDADADAEQIVTEYYGDLYGPAAGQVRAFYELVEEAWVKSIAGEQSDLPPQAAYYLEKGGASESLGRLIATWQPILERAGQLLKEAEDAARSDEEKQRVERVLDHFQLARATTEALMGIADFEREREPDPAAAARVKAAIETREAVLSKIGESYSPSFREWVRTNDDRVRSPLRPTAAFFALAGEASRTKIYARRADPAPEIDGSDEDKAWQKASFVSFRENMGARDAAAPTHAALAYDDSALYILFRCDEPNMDKLKQEAFPRDNSELFNSDNVEVFVDPDGDGESYYHFAINAGGAIYDALNPSADEHDSSWNAAWQASVSVGEAGWNVELTIPLATLGVQQVAEGDSCRLNLHRTRRSTTDRSEYQGMSPTLGGFHQPDRFGELIFGEPKAPTGENLLRKWPFDRFQVGEDITEVLRVGGEGEYSVEITDDRAFVGERALKITVGHNSHASFSYYPFIEEGSYRFSIRYYADPLGQPDPGRPAEAPVSRVIFRTKGGKAVSDSKQYSWTRSPAEQAQGRWADHNHVFRTLPGTERITITVFIHRPGTYWLDDVSLKRL